MKSKISTTRHAVAAGKRWRKVEAPKRWNPRGLGEELVGMYIGHREARGRFGDYRKHLIVRPDKEVMFVSGTVVESLFDGAGISDGECPNVRLVFLGMEETVRFGDEKRREYRNFDLYVEDL